MENKLIALCVNSKKDYKKQGKQSYLQVGKKAGA